ncbi:MAG: sulfotransferase [Methyloceanibacter sp.]|nr:MAG: sulfotransferase [Methyloceanibacter sp.]
MANSDDPIFVRGMSRSGGTLMVTLLDAHSDVAMSYELYPSLVETTPDFDLRRLAGQIASARTHRGVAECTPTKHFATFATRSLRGGLSYKDFAALLVQLADEGQTLAELEGRMRLIELCGLEKMQRTGKRRWGMKCDNSFEDYLKFWPKACFLNMLRDGRDVLASQLNTGSFTQSPKEVARGWQATVRRFEKLVERPDVRARMVRYEALTKDPEPELRSICGLLGLPFDPSMLQHQAQDLTIFKANHLSKQRVSGAIDTTMIGRWRRDLNAAQLADFVSVAGEDLARHGYV